MTTSNTILRSLFTGCIIFLSYFPLYGQQITGVWKGKIDKRKVEVKIIQNGDSLTGTSYYYESAGSYSRYSIKGYFDAMDNSVVWWDDQLIEDRGIHTNAHPLLSVADFNCPGGGVMKLDGKSVPKRSRQQKDGPVDLTKHPDPSFPDEWDFVIDNYTTGANDPQIIDSVGLIAAIPVRRSEVTAEPEPVRPRETMVKITTLPKPEPPPVAKVEPKTPTIREKFTERKKVLVTEIPLEGDSIELRFFDNAQVDGDSISLFLNNQMLFTHVRLTDKAYSLRLSVNDLSENNELVMVAENLGSIPPNTSYMLAIVGDKRYEAQLASTENSSAMIRLRKQ